MDEEIKRVDIPKVWLGDAPVITVRGLTLNEANILSVLIEGPHGNEEADAMTKAIERKIEAGIAEAGGIVSVLVAVVQEGTEGLFKDPGGGSKEETGCDGSS